MKVKKDTGQKALLLRPFPVRGRGLRRELLRRLGDRGAGKKSEAAEFQTAKRIVEISKQY